MQSFVNVFIDNFPDTMGALLFFISKKINELKVLGFFQYSKINLGQHFPYSESLLHGLIYIIFYLELYFSFLNSRIHIIFIKVSWQYVTAVNNYDAVKGISSTKIIVENFNKDVIMTAMLGHILPPGFMPEEGEAGMKLPVCRQLGIITHI